MKNTVIIARKLAEIAMAEIKSHGNDKYLACHAYLSQIRAKRRV
jgi:hypothetical protein